MKRTNLILLAIVLALAILPLLLSVTGALEAPFAGADDQGKEVIVASNPDYQPWFKPIWEPPSGEIENFFFALQGALGGGLLGYCLGLRRGQSQNRKQGGGDAGD